MAELVEKTAVPCPFEQDPVVTDPAYVQAGKQRDDRGGCAERRDREESTPP
jgi:hypothetical protein